MRDAAQRKFERLLVWKASQLGRDMREMISTIYELADIGITVIPVKSQTGTITSTKGKLLWSIQAWFAEVENAERSEAIKAGHARASMEGKPIGRPRVILDRQSVVRPRSEGLSWTQIAKRTGCERRVRAVEPTKPLRMRWCDATLARSEMNDGGKKHAPKHRTSNRLGQRVLPSSSLPRYTLTEKPDAEKEA